MRVYTIKGYRGVFSVFGIRNTRSFIRGLMLFRPYTSFIKEVKNEKTLHVKLLTKRNTP